MSEPEMEHDAKGYAYLFVGWAGSSGRTSWNADVLDNGRGIGVMHQHVEVCADGSCPLTAEWTPLSDYTPEQAIAWAQNKRDVLIRARIPHEGEPVVSDVLISQLGDIAHLTALGRACIPVHAKMTRPRQWPQWLHIVAAIAGAGAAIAVWWFLLHVR